MPSRAVLLRHLLVVMLSVASRLPASSLAADNPKQGSAPFIRARDVRPPASASAVLRLVGNVYPKGLYYAELTVGNPPKPYFLDIDTGSDLSWLQCDAPCIKCSKGPHPLYKPPAGLALPCQNPICASIRSGDGASPNGCSRPTDRCNYAVEYADSGSSLGFLVSDAISLRLTNGSVARPSLALGCGYNQQGAGAGAAVDTDGVLGLGVGKSSIVAQLSDSGIVRNVVGHCLGSKGGGFLFLGDALVPPSGMTWTPLSKRGVREYYTPGPAALFLARQPLVATGFQVVFDSGSSYTYFAGSAYRALLNAITQGLSGKPLKPAPEDRTLPVCWKGVSPFRSLDDVKGYFSSLLLVFPAAGTSSKPVGMEIPGEGQLIISAPGNVCLGILNGTQAGLGDLNVIGDISMQNQLIVYDNDKGRIGWARASCDRNVPPATASRRSQAAVPEFRSAAPRAVSAAFLFYLIFLW